MASRWMREITYDFLSAASSKEWWHKAYALWVYHVMEFTLQTESCGAGRSWISTEKNGTGGAFNGTSYNLTDVAATFTVSDRGKWVVIQDNSNPRNGGIYKILTYNSTTSIGIDFRAGYQEYPLVSSGIKWWIVGPSYQLPLATDYIRLQSRHTTGWAIEFSYTDSPSFALRVRVAPTGNWSAETIGDVVVGGDPNRDVIGVWRYFANGSGRQVYFAEGDYDTCEWMHFFQMNIDPGGDGSSSAVSLVSIERVTPIETGIPDSDLLVLKGPYLFSFSSPIIDLGDRTYLGGNDSVGWSWNSAIQAQVRGYSVEYSYNDYLAGYARWWKREPNRRRDDLLDAMWGEPHIIDVNNSAGNYSYLGYLRGHWVIPLLLTSSALNVNQSHQTANRVIHKMCPININGDRNALIVTDGLVVPWCGLSVLGQGIVP